MYYIKTLSILFLFFLAGTIKIAAQAIPDTIIQKIDNLFKQWNTDKSPGCAIGIVRNDSLIYAKGYGMANMEYGIAITPETIFHMASVSKQFTAFSILLLAKQGKLKLDDDIHTYLPWFPDLKEKITIRQLLNHTSGIRDQWQLLAIAGTRIDDVITQEHIVKVLSQQQALNFKPGAQFSYSNSGFTMLAEIVKSVSKQTLRQFTDSAIFKPLGMGSTHFHDDYTEIVKNRAYSYSRDFPVRFTNSILSYSNAGATSLFTNIRDMSKWVMNFYNHQLGDQAIIEQLTQKSKLNNGASQNYALGIVADTYKGWREYQHSGGDAGFRTYVTVFPDLRMGFIVFSNLGDVNTNDKANQLADLFIKDTTAKTPPVKIDSSRAIVKDSLRVKNFAGNFVADDGAQFSFVFRRQQLCWDRNGRSDLLYPGIKDSFYVAKTPEIKFVFSTTTDKNVWVNEYWPDNERLLKKYTDSALSDKQLQVYTGVYYCPELDCKYGIIIKDHALVMTNNKYEDTKIKLLGKADLFTDYWWMRHLRIAYGDKNTITGFEVNDGRVMHLRFNKIQ